ncbi:MAG: hypothetical protein ABR591_02670 [Candidatus Velthaea sp.]
MIFARCCIVAFAIAGGSALLGAGTPAPVTGGANQVGGISAVWPNAVFDGYVRMKPVYFGAPRSTDGLNEKPIDGKRAWLLEALISNGSTKPFADYPTIALADKDGVTADIRPFDSTNITLQLAQAQAARVRRVYWAPLDFVPDHILFTCAATKCRAMRVILPPSPATAPTPLGT